MRIHILDDARNDLIAGFFPVDRSVFVNGNIPETDGKAVETGRPVVVDLTCK